LFTSKDVITEDKSGLDNKIVIYQSKDGKAQLDVKLEGDTVWLSANQMALLFDKDPKTIRKHINNVFKEGELEKDNNTHFLRVDGVKQSVPFYNLDVIISVGYRVHSQNGVRFRQWANSVLKQYLIKGYVVNERIRKQQIAELRQLVQVVSRTIEQQPVATTDESHALFDVVVDYTYALDTLDDYDYQRLDIAKTTKQESFHATYENAMHEIDMLREKFGAQPSLATRRTIPLRVASDKSIRPSEGRNSIPVWKRRLPCSYILSLRTTHSAMAINVLPPHFSYGL